MATTRNEVFSDTGLTTTGGDVFPRSQALVRRLIDAELRKLLKVAIPAREVPLRSLAFQMVSHATLLRGPGPLGFWSIDAREAQAKTQLNNFQRQNAVILAGIALGLVVNGPNGLVLVQ